MADVILVEAAEAFTHVAVWGRLDAAGVSEVELKLTSQTVARRKPAVIELGDVTFIASLGIGMIVTIARSMRSHGVGLALLVGTTPVREVLDMMAIGSLIPIATTRAEALEKLGVS
jgi:anti-anti-sigma factor